MVKRWFNYLKTAEAEADRRKKNVYKMTDGIYFVGTYEQAMKSIRLAYRHKPKKKKRGK